MLELEWYHWLLGIGSVVFLVLNTQFWNLVGRPVSDIADVHNAEQSLQRRLVEEDQARRAVQDMGHRLWIQRWEEKFGVGSYPLSDAEKASVFASVGPVPSSRPIPYGSQPNAPEVAGYMQGDSLGEAVARSYTHKLVKRMLPLIGPDGLPTQRAVSMVNQGKLVSPIFGPNMLESVGAREWRKRKQNHPVWAESWQQPPLKSERSPITVGGNSSIPLNQ